MKLYLVTALVALVLLVGSSIALAQSSANFDLSRHSINGGGAQSASASYNLTGSIGQVEAGGGHASASFSLLGGFWAGDSSVNPSPTGNSVYLPVILRN
jgi:hypothetical protein